MSKVKIDVNINDDMSNIIFKKEIEYQKRKGGIFLSKKKNGFGHFNQQIMMIRYTLISLITFICISQVICDPCTLLPNVGETYFGTPESVLKCFNNIPLDKEEALAVVESLRGLIKLYSFTDIAKSPPAPHNYFSVNLEYELEKAEQRIRSGAFSSDYDFQVHLLNAFNALSDAHTLYRLPQAYSSCFFVRPFDIEAVYDEKTNDQAFYLRPGPLGDKSVQLWKDTFNFDLTEYLGERIISFDSLSPQEYLYRFATRNIGYYKDNVVKVNAALRRRWGQTTLSMFPLNNSTLEFNLLAVTESRKKFYIPNAVICNGGFKDIDDFVSKNKRQFKAFNEEDVSPENIKRHMIGKIDVYKELDMIKIDESTNSIYMSSEPHMDDVSRIIRQVDGRKYVLNDKTVKVRSDNLKIIASDSSAEDATYMMLTDSEGVQVPVYKLNTFLPTYGTYYVLDLFNTMLKDAEREGHKEVIIDVSYNGGGILCLADLYAALLIEEWGNMSSSNPNAPLGYYDFRKSDLTDSFKNNLILGSLFTNPLFYLSIDTREPYFDFSWYHPGVNYTRGGSTSNYSSRVHFASICIDFPNQFDNPYFEPYRYYFDKVTIVTDGTCGSACSLFMTLLQPLKDRVTVVSYGGLHNNTSTMDTSSFAGGNVLEWGLISTLTEFLGSGPNMPKRFPTNAQARFNYHEYYPQRHSNTPREYMKFEADYHIHQWAPIHNDNLNTPAGKQALANLYATAAYIGRHSPK